MKQGPGSITNKLRNKINQNSRGKTQAKTSTARDAAFDVGSPGIKSKKPRSGKSAETLLFGVNFRYRAVKMSFFSKIISFKSLISVDKSSFPFGTI